MVTILDQNTATIAVNSKGTFLQSYQSVVAGKTPNGVILSLYWDYSVTTCKKVCRWLDCTPKEVRENIKSGKFTLVQVNSLEI